MVTLDIGGTNVTSTATELNYSDLATLGTTAASKVFSADSNNLTAISGAVVLTEDTLSFDATQDWDVRASPVAKVTLTANVTFDAPSNPTTGQYISILCIQDGAQQTALCAARIHGGFVGPPFQAFNWMVTRATIGSGNGGFFGSARI